MFPNVCIANVFVSVVLSASLSSCLGSVLPPVGSSVGSVNGYHTCKGEGVQPVVRACLCEYVYVMAVLPFLVFVNHRGNL